MSKDLTRRFGEAGVFAKTYIPSKLEPTFEAWKAHLLDTNRKILHQRLANPVKHSSQFPELADLIKCGQIVNEWLSQVNPPAFAFSTLQGNRVHRTILRRKQVNPRSVEIGGFLLSVHD